MKINSEIKIVIGIVLVCVIILGLFIAFAPKPGTEISYDTNLLVRADSRMTGKMGAKVTLVEFADYQCPACATVAPYVKNIVDKYKTNPDFNFVHRNFPLPQHGNAVISAEAAEAAGAQGKFFEMGALLYEKQVEWSEVKDPIELFVGYAKTLGLDTVKLRLEITEGKYRDFIQSDLKDANALALNQTPFFFLNGVRVKSLETLDTQIATAMAK